MLVTHWHNKEYELLRDTCIKYIDILENSENPRQTNLYRLYEIRSTAYIYLGEYQLALDSLAGIAPTITEGTHQWVKYNEIKLIAASYLQDYDLCYQITNTVISHRNLKKLSVYVQEEWNMIAAYMSLLVKMGQVTSSVSDEKLKNFRINKFLNDIPIFSKQKGTSNASILIVHACHLIVDKKYDKAFDRMEALKKYAVRHLRKKSESYRFNCFIRMLLEIPKAGFHRAGAERKAKKYHDRLDEITIAETRQQLYLEIIPFEHLWEMLLDHLEIKHHKGRWNN